MPHSFVRSARLALVLAAVVVSFIAGPACAAVLPQQTGGAAAGMNNWHTLAPGQSVEWLFRYPGNNDPALIAFGVEPANSIAVNVYHDGQWRSLGAGVWPVEPVGRGTSGTLGQWSRNQDLIDNGSLFWEAVAWPAVLFHIQVTNLTQSPVGYWIAQAGSGAGELAPYSPITTTGSTSQPAPGEPTPTAQPLPQQPAAAAEGSRPPQTLPVTGRAASILLFAAGLVLVVTGWQVYRGAI